MRALLHPSIKTLVLVLAGLLTTWSAGCTQENRQPTLDPVPTQIVQVGETLRLPITARDPDGDALDFKATPRPVTSSFELVEDGAVFVWPPLISETGPTGKTHTIAFTVEDGHGGLAARTVDITVLPQSNAPIFIGPQGYVLNLSEDDDISFTIAVKDDDSADTTFRVIGGDCADCEEGFICRDNTCQMEGSRFTKLDNKTVGFYWRPTLSQRERGNYWRLVVGAKDESHDEVVRELSVLLMNGDADKSCPGTPPAFTPCGAPSCVPLADLTGVGAIVFQAQGVDFESELREMTLHFATNNPLDSKSYSGNTVSMTRCHPDDDPGCPGDPQSRYFIGILPNPASGATAPLLLHYFLSATDDDDIKGTGCDHVTRFPKEGHFTLATYPTGWAGGCKDDAMEPNDDLSTARPLEPGVTYDLRSCGEGTAEKDWYRIDAEPGAIVGVELTHDNTQGALTLSLHNPDGHQLAPTDDAIANRLIIMPEQSPVYLQVSVPPGEKTADQTYGLVMTRTFGGCPNDDREPNDTLAEAPTILSASVKSTTIDTVICPLDRDWIGVPAWPGESIVANLDFQHSFGDLDLRLYDAAGGLIARSETATSRERVVWHVDTANTYYVEVFGYRGQVNTGRLKLEVVPTATLCFEDNFSPNHQAVDAFLLPENAYFDLLVCAGKEDWFQIDVNEGETVTILAEPFFPDGAELELVGFGDDAGKQILGNSIQIDGSGEGSAAWLANRAEAGPVRWRVRTKGEFTTAYNMLFAVSDPPGECLDDRFSPTNTVKSALDIDGTDGFVTRLKICPGGEDWFRIQGQAFEELSIFVFGFPEEGTLAASLHRFDGPELLHVADGEQTTNGVAIVHLPEANHEFYIHVQGAPGALHHYDLVIFIE
ncbi:MAG: hypothetical protein ACI9WU_001238 [Myxococcota bacterium]|jgi:hypothetical protein